MVNFTEVLLNLFQHTSVTLKYWVIIQFLFDVLYLLAHLLDENFHPN